jgi:hypothetical protein
VEHFVAKAEERARTESRTAETHPGAMAIAHMLAPTPRAALTLVADGYFRSISLSSPNTTARAVLSSSRSISASAKAQYWVMPLRLLRHETRWRGYGGVRHPPGCLQGCFLKV